MKFEQWIVGEMDRGLGPEEVDQMRTAWICALRYGTRMEFDNWVRDIVTENTDQDGPAYRELFNLEKDQMRAAWDAAKEIGE